MEERPRQTGDEPTQRLSRLLRAAGLSQAKVARRMSRQLGWHVSQSRLSRAAHGQVTLTHQERQALFDCLWTDGALCDREDAELVARLFGLDAALVDQAFPPPRPVTNLAAPDDTLYLPPPILQPLKAALLSRIHAGQVGHVFVEGSPGSGKTTLVRHLAADPDLGHRFAVILYAALDGTTPPAQAAAVSHILNEWLTVLGEPPTDGRLARAALRRRLHDRRTLVILDGLLDATLIPDLAVADRGGALLVVGPSAVADQSRIPPADRFRLEEWDDDTARRYVQSLTSTPLPAEHARRISQFNRLLNGLPLAWVVLAPLLRAEPAWADLLAGLDRAPLATLHPIDHRLETCFQAAYARLKLQTQSLFRALGAFAPGVRFDLAAVADVLDRPPTELRPHLAALKLAGLLHTEERDVYRVHHLLHHFAAALLEADPRRDEYARRHAHFYARLAAPLLERQTEADWPAVVRRLLPDLPNVYHGQAWAAARGDPLTVRYFLHLAPWFVATRDLDRYRRWGQQARAVVEREPETFPALDRYALYAQLSWLGEDIEERLACARQAQRIAAGEMEPWNEAYALCHLARLQGASGDLAAAEASLAGAWRIAGGSDRPRLRPWVLREIGLYFVRSRQPGGCAVVARLLAKTPPTGIGEGMKAAYDAASRGDIFAAAGQWESALAAYRDALDFHQALDDRPHAAEERARMAVCLGRLGRRAEAEEPLAQVQGQLPELPPQSVKRYHLASGLVAHLAGQSEAAVEHLEAALAIAGPEELRPWEMDFEALLTLGQAYDAQERATAAKGAWQRALALARERRQPHWIEEVRGRLVGQSPETHATHSELVNLIRR